MIMENRNLIRLNLLNIEATFGDDPVCIMKYM